MKKKLICAIAFLAATCIIVACFFLYKSRINKYSGKIEYVRTSAYEKLAFGDEINILVVGDSIGAGTGSTSGMSWAALLPGLLTEKYGSKCKLTNISMGGNTSYAGMVMTKILDDGIDYDLAIICYGENDSIETLHREYEAIIRAIQGKYSGCSIISVLESSQREYTEKIRMIMDIDDYYDIPVANTIKAFNESGYEYEGLVNSPDDLTHPNDTGYKIYLDTIADVIDNQVSSLATYTEDTHSFDNMLYYDSKDLKRKDACVYELKLNEPITADIGLFRNFIHGENGVKIYADGVLIVDSDMYWDPDFEQGHIYNITDKPVHIDSRLRIEFSSKELANSFYGIIFTGKGK